MTPADLTSDRARLWTVVAVLSAATAVVFAAMVPGPLRETVDAVDRSWLRAMVAAYDPSVAVVTAAFAALGGVWVTAPLRVAVSAWLLWRRRWARLTVWLVSIAVSEVAITLLKPAYDRARPPFGLEVTDTASFPSGHAVAASVTAVALVAALTSAGRRRWHWWTVAIAFAVAMAFTRTYLRVHWLSDVVAGSLLGTSIGLACVAAVETVRAARRPGPRPWSSDRTVRRQAE